MAWARSYEMEDQRRTQLRITGAKQGMVNPRENMIQALSVASLSLLFSVVCSYKVHEFSCGENTLRLRLYAENPSLGPDSPI